ncbi:MAG: hypothetical protein WCT18_03430 [Patescibacteria group bacterium]
MSEQKNNNQFDLGKQYLEEAYKKAVEKEKEILEKIQPEIDFLISVLVGVLKQKVEMNEFSNLHGRLDFAVTIHLEKYKGRLPICFYPSYGDRPSKEKILSSDYLGRSIQEFLTKVFEQSNYSCECSFDHHSFDLKVRRK